MKRLMTSVMVGLVGIQGLALFAEDRPKLVVGIVVDQLRTDYLESLYDKLSPGGFRRLMDKGIFIKDVDFKIPSPDAASATAIIQTGSYPRQNGVISAKIYSPSEKKEISVFHDPSYIGNFTSQTFSPSSLKVSTLSDEIALDNNGSSQILSVSINPEEALILAGHAGNSAFWIDDETGKWSSTTYYTSAPAIIQNRNYNSPLLSRLDTMRWIPSRREADYKDISSSRLKSGFRHTFPRSDRDVFKFYKSSPYVNSDITDIAADYLQNLDLGRKDENTDVLNLEYSLAPYPAVTTGDGKFELQDSYLRLDNDIERLFKQLDKNVGLDNVLVYITSTGYYSEPEKDFSAFRLPSGTFSVKRALSLLNAYLAAKYGNGSYVDQYFAGHIYLDHQTIEERSLDITKVAEDARDFLVRMSGVTDAYTISDLQSPAVAQLESHRLANDPKSSGDIIMEFNPGWKVIDDSRFPNEVKPDHSTIYATPVMIWQSGITPRVITEPVDATAIAPTIARILRIRSPNASVSRPLFLN